MEVTKKELKQAIYNVTCTSDDYTIVGNITIGKNNTVINMDSCQITKKGEFVASFGEYSNSLNINYNSSITLEEQGVALSLINDFKNVSVSA